MRSVNVIVVVIVVAAVFVAVDVDVIDVSRSNIPDIFIAVWKSFR